MNPVNLIAPALVICAVVLVAIYEVRLRLDEARIRSIRKR